jgi:16S rRNA (guanine527-N7)-methyltransferase
MTEEEARAWLSAHNVPRETLGAIDRFLDFLGEEAARQNLIAASTADMLWARHVVDSAQLLDHAGAWKTWLDLGSGAGFPGLIVALLGTGHVTLIESRAKRIAFLNEAAAIAGISHRVTVVGSRVETAPRARFDVISARAFAPLPKLLGLAQPFSDETTQWILPKGKSAAEELEAARASWQGEFRLVPSVTDSQAAIIVATGVTVGKKRR